MQKTQEQEQLKWPDCEVCGKPATNGVRDYSIDSSPHLRGQVEKRAVGKMHNFCDEHKRDAHVVNVTRLGLMF